jgi:hypothetical protein
MLLINKQDIYGFLVKNLDLESAMGEFCSLVEKFAQQKSIGNFNAIKKL